MIERFNLVKAMNLLVLALNDEDAYARWIITVPDGATEEDLLDISQDSSMINEVTEEFIRIMNTYGRSGFCIGNELFPS